MPGETHATHIQACNAWARKRHFVSKYQIVAGPGKQVELAHMAAFVPAEALQ